MKLLYAGFDTVDVAFQGAFPSETIALLSAARDSAAQSQEPVLAQIGPQNVPMFIAPSGLKGGFAFRADTGPLGETLAFKSSADTSEWNCFASIYASTLAAYGYPEAKNQIFSKLSGMGFTVTGHSVNRIDYAADFLVPTFDLRLDDFVAHPRTKVRPHWGASEIDPNQPSAILTGRRLESVTIGKMPGRQIIVYDKRRAAIAQRKFFWFKAWGLEQKDQTAQVCRVEIRAGKKELKQRWNIRSFEDVNQSIGDVIRTALNEIRYLSPVQTDSNVTRQNLDPLWHSMINHVEGGLFEYRSGLLPSEIKNIERQYAIDTYSALVLGNLAGLAVAKGLEDRDLGVKLAPLLHRLLTNALNDPQRRFQKSVSRARIRLHFVQ